MHFRWLLAGQVKLWTCILCRLSFFQFLIYPFWCVLLNSRFSLWGANSSWWIALQAAVLPLSQMQPFLLQKGHKSWPGAGRLGDTTPHLHVCMAQLLNRCTVSLLGGRSVFLSGFWVWEQIPWHSYHVWGEFSVQVSERGAIKTLMCFVSVPCYLYDSLATVSRIIHSLNGAFVLIYPSFCPEKFLMVQQFSGRRECPQKAGRMASQGFGH